MTAHNAYRSPRYSIWHAPHSDPLSEKDTRYLRLARNISSGGRRMRFNYPSDLSLIVRSIERTEEKKRSGFTSEGRGERKIARSRRD